MRLPFFALISCSVLVTSQKTSAAPVTVMEENGVLEFSADNQAPTDLGVFGVGNNTVAGTVTQVGTNAGGSFVDFEGADVFTFEVATGTRIDELFLRSFSSSSNVMFMSIDDQDTFLYSPTQINTGAVSTGDLSDNTAMWGSVGESDDVDNATSDPDSGTNLLTSFPGLQDSLEAGNYTVYLQETGTSSSYTLNFRVTAVPEPTAALALLPLGYLVYRRQRSAKRAAKA